MPLGAGLSSSAALECAVAVGAAHLLGLDDDRATRRGLAAACIRAESEVAGAPTGGMDQTVALLAEAGAALLIDFDDGTTRAVPLPWTVPGSPCWSPTRGSRTRWSTAGTPHAARTARRPPRRSGLPSLRHADEAAVERLEDDRVRRRARHVVREIAPGEETVEALDAGDWARVGRLFGDSHASMRDDFEISCDELDTVVSTAVHAGALGARMTGGGFGGSAISLVPEERVAAVMRAIDLAFVAAGYRAPAHLRGEPSGPAAVVLPSPGHGAGASSIPGHSR